MSSTDNGFRRSPLIVSTHFDKKRVSNENKPVGSVSDASMSPRRSQTTNVLPSRIFTRSSATATRLSGRCCRARSFRYSFRWRSREYACERHEQIEVAFDDQRAAQYRGHRVLPSRRDLSGTAASVRGGRSRRRPPCARRQCRRGRTSTRQRSTALPSVSSKRREPEDFASNGWCPAFWSSAKNFAVWSAIVTSFTGRGARCSCSLQATLMLLDATLQTPTGR